MDRFIFYFFCVSIALIKGYLAASDWADWSAQCTAPSGDAAFSQCVRDCFMFRRSTDPEPHIDSTFWLASGINEKTLYRYSGQKVTIAEAAQTCEQWGGELAKISVQGRPVVMQERLIQHISKAFLDQAGKPNYVWTGERTEVFLNQIIEPGRMEHIGVNCVVMALEENNYQPLATSCSREQHAFLCQEQRDLIIGAPYFLTYNRERNPNYVTLRWEEPGIWKGASLAYYEVHYGYEKDPDDLHVVQSMVPEAELPNVRLRYSYWIRVRAVTDLGGPGLWSETLKVT